MTTENGALGQGLGQGHEGGLVPAVARYSTAGRSCVYMTCLSCVDSRMVGCDVLWVGLWYECCAQHSPRKNIPIAGPLSVIDYS